MLKPWVHLFTTRLHVHNCFHKIQHEVIFDHKKEKCWYGVQPYCPDFRLQHNFKKTRNNILKSLTEDSGTPCLTSKGKTITWDQFWKTFNYDRGKFCMSLHHKLTEDHFQLDHASKMCNHLTEDVLDRNMLAPMKVFSVPNACILFSASLK